MGYNTAAVILNDGLDQFKKDPDVGIKIYDAITTASRTGSNTVSIGNHCNPMMVLQPMHADYDQIVVIGQNYIRTICRMYGMPHQVEEQDLQLHLMKHLANQLGYYVRRK